MIYFSCCIDELAGERWGVDAIIHYGNACLSATVGRVPFLHVFGRPPCPALQYLLRICHDVTNLIFAQHKDSATAAAAVPCVLFACDFRYQAAARQMAEVLAAELAPHSVSLWLGEPVTAADKKTTGPTTALVHAGRRFCPLGASTAEKSPLVPTASWSLVYLGACDVAFYRVLVTLRQSYALTALTIDPQSGEVSPATKSAAAFLRRRYYLMEKAKEAKRIGILVHTSFLYTFIAMRGTLRISKVVKTSARWMFMGGMHLSLVNPSFVPHAAACQALGYPVFPDQRMMFSLCCSDFLLNSIIHYPSLISSSETICGKAKRHRSVLRDNIQVITKPAIRRLVRRGGVKRIIYEETHGVLKIGTLSTQRYTDVTARLKRLLHAAHKSYLTLVVGRINEAKLLNIPNLGALVLIACPESSLFDDPSIPLPILTPYELECALHSLLAPGEAHTENQADRPSRIWQGDRLWLDFADILPGGSAYLPEESVCDSPVSASGDDATAGLQFSALSLASKTTDGSDLPLVLRDEANWSLALACEDLSASSGCWRGLDPRMGETEVARIQPGRSGVPVDYRTAEG
ncbi:unnamed protein product [Schistocephalus solidus]|uniref:2-(3-amino-3-carboxypropyl)histidine synthase subunit 1 n=1 Tax=Schistocephalus solidus TaxID=70667 RepID=A0A183TN00_SCHSO|nr:unnamed protein product [Schistocephalus solidus]